MDTEIARELCSQSPEIDSKSGITEFPYIQSDHELNKNNFTRHRNEGAPRKKHHSLPRRTKLQWIFYRLIKPPGVRQRRNKTPRKIRRICLNKTPFLSENTLGNSLLFWLKTHVC